jgi:hypothetical protein
VGLAAWNPEDVLFILKLSIDMASECDAIVPVRGVDAPDGVTFTICHTHAWAFIIRHLETSGENKITLVSLAWAMATRACGLTSTPGRPAGEMGVRMGVPSSRVGTAGGGGSAVLGRGPMCAYVPFCFTRRFFSTVRSASDIADCASSICPHPLTRTRMSTHRA